MNGEIVQKYNWICIMNVKLVQWQDV